MMKISCCGQHLELVMELMFLLRELKEKLQYYEMQDYPNQQLELYWEMISPIMEEYLENYEIPLSEELYQELCKHLGSGRIEFMGIA
tara:strand:- start:962 stop:1222 length:261 start_codon:yes stop_codon:yes gene_type:complete